MKNWLYFAMAAFLAVGFSSCRDDYSSEFEDLKRMEDQSATKLDSLNKAQEDLNKKQEELNKKQAELAKLQDELSKLQQDLLKLQEQLGLLGNGTQDSTAVGQQNQDLVISEIKKLQAELAIKLDALAKAQEELQKLQGIEPTHNEGEYVDTTSSATAKKYELPTWVPVEAEGDYAYTMTVTFELPTVLKSSASADDMIAAFVGDECRGIAKLSDGVFLMDVLGTGSEAAPVTFRYWCAGNHYMYESLTSIPFTIDFVYGVVDEPKMFNCKQL